ncbi:class I SAM-dependent methyltransferase [Mangrovimicrobium sediminis]|uniref:Class I SAM-dependent methyltransferase n=1 Tax=Mangrovimicrobium sediminis TaxID=2562682 RepID=A0A4Z0M572_9GAMM|nr:cyclopropane-fatty-acyl-phospholipid synthase family protein [Haliea sp. SAOS-164]TGD74802.1 class I SAM-dependent methyltransferase [Haliea sp. SAOS-164]
MSEASVSAIRLPSIRGFWRGEDMARRMVYRLLGGLSGGSLVLHESGSSVRFGAETAAGMPHVEIRVRDPRAFQYVLTGGVVGAGEAYMLGYWTSPDLVAVIRLFSANMAAMDAMDANSSRLRQLLMWGFHKLNGNTRNGSRRNIGAHYDLGNDFFRLFLDEQMMYSAAVYPSPETSLEEASLHKLDLLCQQLELQPEDHLLEIGTGWGGLAIHAARHYGCRVTTTTISREQYNHACERVAQAGLADRVEVLCQDYRELGGQYDKLVSVEMIEAVGHEFYSEYFRRCSALLRPGGKFAIQAITMADQRYVQARDSVDFIKRYIFPGGCLPSLEVIARHVARDTDMQIVNLRDITLDYARTLEHWRERFLAAREQVRGMGFDEVFLRMWEFYLCYCEGGFRERIISTVQLTMAKPGYRFDEPGHRSK